MPSETFIVDSQHGSKNVSAKGDYFEVHLEEGINIPYAAQSCKLELESATVWWTIPNIITGQNDKMTINAPRASDDVITAYNITIPQGLYNTKGLESAILNELSTAGAKTNPTPVINLDENVNTQKIVIILNYASSNVDFTVANTPRELLGFNATVISNQGNNTAPNVANFSTVEYLLLHSDLVSKGLRVGNTHNQTIGRMLIDKLPGSQLIYTPINPIEISCNNLIGSVKRILRFWLTDEKGNSVSTNSDPWSMVIKITWE